MASPNYARPLLSILVYLITIAATRPITASPPAVKAAYWPSWDENFPPSAIITNLFTHIYYAFLMPNSVTYKFDGSPAVDVGPGDKGFVHFVQVEEFNRINGATVVHDVESMSTYSFAGSTWIGYDDEISATIKIGFAQALGLRGYFFWALSYDSEWKISTQVARAWIRSD